jgi:hypothetical protein
MGHERPICDGGTMSASPSIVLQKSKVAGRLLATADEVICRWNGKAERLRRLEIDEEVIFAGFLERQITDFFAAQHAVDIGCGAAKDINAKGPMSDINHG